jgi:hypothetical protein
MANLTEYRTQQKGMIFRRIQVILIGVIAVSVLEHSAKRDEKLQANRANQRIAATSQRKAVTSQPAKSPAPQPSKSQPSKSQDIQSQSSIALKPSKPSIKSGQ